MASALTDKFRKSKAFASTKLSSSISDSDTAITLENVSGWPTDTAITIVIDRVDANAQKTPTKREVITGTLSGSVLTTDSTRRGLDSTTTQPHTASAVVELNSTAAAWNDTVDGILVAHNQDGTQKDNSVTTAAIQDSAVTAAKIASLPSRRQADTTNTTPNVAIQAGWGYIVGNGSSTIAKTVTFPAAFATPPIVTVTALGTRATSAGTPTGPDWFTGNAANNARINTAITTTGFTALISEESAGTLANTTNYGFTWIAIG